MSKKDDGFVKVGQIGVDSGMLWVGDPCYVIHAEEKKALGKDWDAFVTHYYAEESGGTLSLERLGVALNTNQGDGLYDVLLRRTLSEDETKDVIDIRIIRR
jgi:hypothetical protein